MSVIIGLPRRGLSWCFQAGEMFPRDEKAIDYFPGKVYINASQVFRLF